MIQKIVKKHRLQERTTMQEDLAYWLSKTPEERVATVDYLRTQYYGNPTRLQRVARVVQRPPR
jgi:ribosome recycling factor